MKMPIAVTQQMEQNAPTLFVDQLKITKIVSLITLDPVLQTMIAVVIADVHILLFVYHKMTFEIKRLSP